MKHRASKKLTGDEGVILVIKRGRSQNTTGGGHE